MTGQILFRKTSTSVEGMNDDERLFMFVGIVKAPKDAFKDGHQYTIGPLPLMETEQNIIQISSEGIDRQESCKGKELGRVLVDPIWRV